MYTHTTKKSGQQCYQAAWWPTMCDKAIAREKSEPLMVLQNGQVTRINRENLETIKVKV